MSATIVWFIVGVGCMVLETASPLFVIVFFGLGAWAASLSMYFGASLAVSFGVFSVVSVVSLAVLRRMLIKTFQGSTQKAQEGSEQVGLHVGKQGVVSQAISAGDIGEMSLAGSFWRAVLHADASVESLDIGARVIVVAHDPDDGILLQVRPV